MSCAATDPRLVVAQQRVLRLTMNETLNTVRYLIDADEAQALADRFARSDSDSQPLQRRFPPLAFKTIESSEYTRLDEMAEHVGDYVQGHYAELTMALAECSAASDACATAYLTKLAARAYRRALTADEQTHLMTLYQQLRDQTFNGYDVPGTVEEATGSAVYALLSSPQVLWRTEFGDPTRPSPSLAGNPLSDAELATHLAFFLTDQPPDDQLLDAANSNTLRLTLNQHVNRLLSSPGARDWLRTIIETYFGFNFPGSVDPVAFPTFDAALGQDIRTETRMFLDHVLWTGDLQDLLLSRTTFLNTSLATKIYDVHVPSGATSDTFVETTLPANRRSGLLTNAGFLLSHGISDGRRLVGRRGDFVNRIFLCRIGQSHPDDLLPRFFDAATAAANQTGSQQVAARASPDCAVCHAEIDSLGLPLENYDLIGRWRTTYAELPGMPRVESAATLPAFLGGQQVRDAVDLAQRVATSQAFINCMAATVLQYALVDFDTAFVEVPFSPKRPGCAASDVASRFRAGTSKTFSDLIRATIASPAFVLRGPAP